MLAGERTLTRIAGEAGRHTARNAAAGCIAVPGPPEVQVLSAATWAHAAS